MEYTITVKPWYWIGSLIWGMGLALALWIVGAQDFSARYFVAIGVGCVVMTIGDTIRKPRKH
jgi:hypothetical protein